jgi:hypothetical protein
MFDEWAADNPEPTCKGRSVGIRRRMSSIKQNGKAQDKNLSSSPLPSRSTMKE